MYCFSSSTGSSFVGSINRDPGSFITATLLAFARPRAYGRVFVYSVPMVQRRMLMRAVVAVAVVVIAIGGVSLFFFFGADDDDNNNYL